MRRRFVIGVMGAALLAPWLVNAHGIKNHCDEGQQHRQRPTRGIGQESLAELSGLHRTYVGSVEGGERNIAAVNIEPFSKCAGVRYQRSSQTLVRTCMGFVVAS